MTIKVLIIDDSALVRTLLTRILNQDPEIEVVGTATDPYMAREKIKKLNPDVLTLDVEMPKMDGITFLRNLMRLRPMPVVMVSSLTEKGAEVTLQALELGAVDFVTKPRGEPASALERLSQEIVHKVKVAAGANLSASGGQRGRPGAAHEAIDVREKHTADVILPARPARRPAPPAMPLVAIGASTGGTEAIKEVLCALPADFPPVVITQHIPSGFSTAFANRMNRLSALSVCEAQDNQQILPGHVYIAPGARHLLVSCSNEGLRCRLHDGPRVNRHKPSVDVLFRSVAQCCGDRAIGVILTGMGDDGARCLLEMRQAGAYTIAQDEASSVVWGMPGSAVKLGAAQTVLPLDKIPAELLKQLARMRPTMGGRAAAVAGLSHSIQSPTTRRIP